ncbi:hypothetical protein BJ508DRAFT_364325 [Ascobolus immersus RN42]|uniref:Uncharacterized protein n=1 Tax=Ascobolus immersus RN42 TaxID=1160509 RepID=A0A3N4HV22_ASCIM|nr:hypothetical protein BJ508DRAFT_364325 [Ascobolus immersus RN42]
MGEPARQTRRLTRYYEGISAEGQSRQINGDTFNGAVTHNPQQYLTLTINLFPSTAGSTLNLTLALPPHLPSRSQAPGDLPHQNLQGQEATPTLQVASTPLPSERANAGTVLASTVQPTIPLVDSAADSASEDILPVVDSPSLARDLNKVMPEECVADDVVSPEVKVQNLEGRYVIPLPLVVHIASLRELRCGTSDKCPCLIRFCKPAAPKIICGLLDLGAMAGYQRASDDAQMMHLGEDVPSNQGLNLTLAIPHLPSHPPSHPALHLPEHQALNTYPGGQEPTSPAPNPTAPSDSSVLLAPTARPTIRLVDSVAELDAISPALDFENEPDGAMDDEGVASSDDERVVVGLPRRGRRAFLCGLLRLPRGRGRRE